MFFGHDHLNDFCLQTNKTDFLMCYAGSAGYGINLFIYSFIFQEKEKRKRKFNIGAYGQKGFERRVRLIEFQKKGSNNIISTWKRLDNSHLEKIDYQIVGSIPTTAYQYSPTSMIVKIALLMFFAFVLGATSPYVYEILNHKRIPKYSKDL